MGFFDDISRWAGNATGGFIGESDEERRRKQRQQQQSRPAQTTLRMGTPSAPSAARPAQASQVSQQARPTYMTKIDSVGLTNEANTDDSRQAATAAREKRLMIDQMRQEKLDMFGDKSAEDKVGEFNDADVWRQREMATNIQRAVNKAKGGNTAEDARREAQGSLLLEAIESDGDKKSGNLLTLGQDLGKGIADQFTKTGGNLARMLHQATGGAEQERQALESTANATYETANTLRNAGKIDDAEYRELMAKYEGERFLADRAGARNIDESDPVKAAMTVANAGFLGIGSAAGVRAPGAAFLNAFRGTGAANATAQAVKQTLAQKLVTATPETLTASGIAKIVKGISPEVARLAGVIGENVVANAPQAFSEVGMERGADATAQEYAVAQLLSAGISAGLPLTAAGLGKSLNFFKPDGSIDRTAVSKAVRDVNRELEKQGSTEKVRVSAVERALQESQIVKADPNDFSTPASRAEAAARAAAERGETLAPETPVPAQAVPDAPQAADDIVGITNEARQLEAIPEAQRTPEQQAQIEAAKEQLVREMQETVETARAEATARPEVAETAAVDTLDEAVAASETTQFSDAPKRELPNSLKDDPESLSKASKGDLWHIEYHGTSSPEVAAEIRKGGFKAGQNTKGVSTTQDYREALDYANGNPDAVVATWVRDPEAIVGEPGKDFLSATGSFAPEDLTPLSTKASDIEAIKEGRYTPAPKPDKAAELAALKEKAFKGETKRPNETKPLVAKEKPNNATDAQSLLKRAMDAGMSRETAVKLMKENGRNKFFTMLNKTNDLKGAKNADALATDQLKKVEDGNIQRGGVAKKRETVETAVGKTDTTTGEIVEPTPKVEVKESKPQTPAEEFGTQIREAYTREQKVWESIDKKLSDAGYDPTDVRKKITASERRNYDPTDSDQAAFRIVQDELDDARQALAKDGVEFDGDRTFYRPEQRQGSVRTSPDDYTREDLLDFGYSKRRTGALGLEEIDYTANPEIDYTFKARNRDLVVKNSIAKSAEADGRTVTKESVEEAADLTIQMQETINTYASKSEGVLKHDTIGQLYAIGKAEGYDQSVNTTRTSAVDQEPLNMLERAGIYDRGFQQYANADGYAHEVMNIAEEIGEHPMGIIGQSLRKAFPEADKSTMGNIAAWAERRLEQSANPHQQLAIVAGAFRKAAKAEVTKLGKTMTFADGKLAKVVNEQTNHVLVNDAYRRNYAQKLDNFIAHRINESLRGANVLSAMFEASDFFNIMSDFGPKNLGKSKIGLGKVDGDYYGMSRRYGREDQYFLSPDLAKEAATLDRIWSDPRTNVARKVYESARNIRDKTLLFRYVEKWKTELFLRQADEFYRAKGLKGKELVDMVNGHFNKTMLPSTALTMNRLLGKMPKSLNQYLSWGVNSTKRIGRTLSGTNNYGKYADMSRAGRIARGVGMEIVPKVATAMAIGMPLTQVLGGRDWTGLSTGDYSGIDKEDQNALDSVVNLLAVSPALGMLANYYNAYRVNQEAKEAGEVESEWFKNASEKNKNMMIPFHSQYEKVKQVYEGQRRGFYENRDGRIQTEKLSTGEAVMGATLGKRYTPSFRNYNDNPDALSVARKDANLLDLITHNETVENIVKAMGGETARDYTRPLSNSAVDGGFNQAAREAFKAAQEKHGANSSEAKQTLSEWIRAGREYNKVFDKFRKDDPAGYKAWEKTVGDDVISPEKWKVYEAHPEVFEFTRKRKELENKHLGRPIDPVFRLKDEGQRNTIMAIRSAFTGDDGEIKEELYAKKWFKDFSKEEDAYYAAQEEYYKDAPQTEQTKRARDYFKLSREKPQHSDLYQQYIDTRYGNEEKGIAADEEAGKEFYKMYADQLSTDYINRSWAIFEWTNKMRGYEKADKFTEEQWAEKYELEQNEDGTWSRKSNFKSGWSSKDGKKRRSSSKGSGGSGSSEGDRMYVDALLTNYAAQASDGKANVKGPTQKLVDVKKAWKKPKRASSQSPIKIKI